MIIHWVIATTLLIILASGYTGCSPSGPSPNEQRIQQLKQEKVQLAKEARLEKEKLAKKIQLEKHAREDAEKETSNWKFYTIISVFIGGILLVIGAGMGSSAKKDAEDEF